MSVAKKLILEQQFQALEIAVMQRSQIGNSNLEKEIENLITANFGADPDITVNVFNKIKEIKEGGRVTGRAETNTKFIDDEHRESTLDAGAFLRLGLKKKKPEGSVVQNNISFNKKFADDTLDLENRFVPEGGGDDVKVKETIDDEIDYNTLSEDDKKEIAKLQEYMEAMEDDLIVRFNGYVGLQEFTKISYGVDLSMKTQEEGLRIFKQTVYKRIMQIVNDKNNVAEGEAQNETSAEKGGSETTTTETGGDAGGNTETTTTKPETGNANGSGNPAETTTEGNQGNNNFSSGNS